ncbi:maleylpyruvate isomerase family mycothiol-dependent enzyme [Actinomadura macrotermitis]|uniref:Mycothiol-dependent maleylpyruvate isomerase metal-binding domain-containing protein n=1 Tax=Actinomadura macrotermitis TaxID=2585200 RepID=A0A7K0C584_9ACTN|nr:maleylpyruvate isomerase family mycothiol-dependent enzyme [Actinomadura macrotermitis]MQY08607.1 hypothetical protein [Actinomadura macrotermitis]
MADTAIFDDLAAEYERLDGVLAGLAPGQWDAPSAAAGWTVCDVVLHLTQSEEMVVLSAGGRDGAFAREEGVPLDELMDGRVRQERGASGAEVLARWRDARTASVAALRACPDGARLSWAAVPLSPRTLAATRMAEHWAHALDITGPLGIGYPDTARLRHIARLAQRTLPYAFKVAGVPGGPVRCELTGPGGEEWRFGDGESVIRGSAAEFCRVGARRLRPEDTSLAAEGPYAKAALQVMRNYAV